MCVKLSAVLAAALDQLAARNDIIHATGRVGGSSWYRLV